MDDYLGYNQTRQHRPDEANDAFYVDNDIFNYKVMPFRLVNTRSPYQMLVNKLFKNILRRNMETYVDDMLIISIKDKFHVSYFWETFECMHLHRVHFNPFECLLKTHMYSLLALVKHVSGKSLFLYLSINTMGISAVFMKEEVKAQLPIY